MTHATEVALTRANAKFPRRQEARSSRSRVGVPPETVVRRGWNRLSITYRPDGSDVDATGHRYGEYRAWLRPLMRALPRGSRVLDLGCGNGDPVARLLCSRFALTGIDISDVQIRRARALLPRARFLRADMTAVRFAPGSFDAVVAFYSMIHVPVRKQRPLIRRVSRWLGPRGMFLGVLGKTAWTGRETSWLGMNTPMFWSHTDAGTYDRWLRAEGFQILRRKYIPEGDSGHELFLARKGSGERRTPRRRAHPGSRDTV